MRVLASNEQNQILKLDKKDKQILALLCKNARLPLTKIGDSVGLSRESIEYRIKRFKEAQIITGSRTLINIRKLNNYSFHVFISLHNPKEEEKFLTRLKEHPNVNVVIKYSGKWDFEVSIMTDSPESFYDIFYEISEGINIQDYHILLLLNTIKSIVLQKKYLENTENITVKRNDFSFFKDFSKKKEDNYKLDEKDMIILKLISDDAETKITEIAKKTKLSPDTITYRLKKLIYNNYIIEFRPIINYSALKLSIQALLIRTKSIRKEDEKQLFMFLKEHDNILWATKTFGNWNLLVYAITEHQNDFHKLIDELTLRFPDLIKNYESLFAYQEYKYTFLAKGVEPKKI
ncbi:MAG: Lrp/AsnC family transcriptional regulator [Candidatus Woesearchaeota archaeon]|jgi:Lrp/AsnC family leucine-responsive transcriptional regulator